MIRSVFILVVVCVSWECFPQPTIQWQRTFGGSEPDELYSIKQTTDNGYILAGFSGSADGDVFFNRGGSDIWLLKLNDTGAIQWKKTYGGSDNDYTQSIIQTSDNGYFVAGNSLSNNFDVSGNHGSQDGWAIKLDSLGNLEWEKSFGGSDTDFFWDAVQCQDQGYIMVGNSSSIDSDLELNNGGFDVWIVKISETGTILWQKNLGGSGSDRAKKIITTNDGGYMVIAEAGSQDGDVPNSHGGFDFWLIKLSIDGDIEWQNTYGGEGYDIVTDIVQDQENNYIVCGFVGSDNTGQIGPNHGLLDYWVIKVSSAGDLIWQNNFGGSGVDYARAIANSNDNGYLIAGSTDSVDGDVIGNDGGYDFWVVRVNDLGELVWQQTYGGTKADGCYEIEATNDHGFVLGGLTWSDNEGDLIGSSNHGKDDYWVVKFGPESLGLSSSNSSPLTITPNPSSSEILLSGIETQGLATITATNIFGQSLLRKQIAPSETINISQLPSGIYIISVSDKNGKCFIGKMEKI